MGHYQRRVAADGCRPKALVGYHQDNAGKVGCCPYKFRPVEVWVVAIIGSHAIWYNECWFGDQLDGMDSGFCCSNYAVHGQLGDDSSVVGMLGDTVQIFLNRIRFL
jgi:hypothetical protein